MSLSRLLGFILYYFNHYIDPSFNNQFFQANKQKFKNIFSFFLCPLTLITTQTLSNGIAFFVWIDYPFSPGLMILTLFFVWLVLISYAVIMTRRSVLVDTKNINMIPQVFLSIYL